MAALAIGVDIGGSHISAAQVALNTHTIVADTFVRREVDAGMDAARVIKAWAGVIREALPDRAAWPVIGIAIPGPFDYQRGVSLVTEPGKYDSLLNINVRELLARELKTDFYDIVTRNDAACFLQGEVLGGAAVSCHCAIGVTLGTGLGTAWYKGGRTEDADRWNAPFGTTIAEDYLSARWFLRQNGETEPHSGGVAALAEKARSDDRGLKSLFAEFGVNLGIFLADFVRDIDPEVIVVGGGIRQASDLFFPNAERTLRERSITVPLRKAELGEAAAIIGAAKAAITR
jgi:glucokinase